MEVYILFNRFLVPSSLPLCIQKWIVVGLCYLPQTQFRAYPRLPKPSLMETWNWGVKLGKPPSCWAPEALIPAACLELKAPPCWGGGVWHLDWMNARFSGQHSSWMKAETPGKRESTERRKANGREPKKCDALRRASRQDSRLFTSVFPEHPCLLSAPNTSLGMAGAGHHMKKHNKTKSSADVGQRRILDSRPETVAPTQQMQ